MFLPTIWNRTRGIALSLLLAGLLLPLTTPKAMASAWDRKTVITFHESVEIPGQVLPAGTYVFKLMNSSVDRHIVQVFDRDERHLYATLLTIPDYRIEAANETEIQFAERPSDQPQAIRTWFYPGNTMGEAFVYRHVNSGLQVAKNVPAPATVETVSTDTEPAVTTSTPTDSASTAASTPEEPAVVDGPPAPAAEPPSPFVEQPDPDTPVQDGAPTTTTTPDKAETPSTLPKTASPLPLIGIAGTFSLLAGAMLRARRRSC